MKRSYEDSESVSSKRLKEDYVNMTLEEGTLLENVKSEGVPALDIFPMDVWRTIYQYISQVNSYRTFCLIHSDLNASHEWFWNNTTESLIRRKDFSDCVIPEMVPFVSALNTDVYLEGTFFHFPNLEYLIVKEMRIQNNILPTPKLIVPKLKTLITTITDDRRMMLDFHTIFEDIPALVIKIEPSHNFLHRSIICLTAPIMVETLTLVAKGFTYSTIDLSQCKNLKAIETNLSIYDRPQYSYLSKQIGGGGDLDQYNLDRFDPISYIC